MQTTSFRASTTVSMFQVVYTKDSTRISVIWLSLLSIFWQTSSQNHQSIQSIWNVFVVLYLRYMGRISSRKSHKMEHALWLYTDVLFVEAFKESAKDSANVRRASLTSCGCSDKKSRTSIIRRFSHISRARLLDGKSGSAAAEASAPAREPPSSDIGPAPAAAAGFL